MQPSLHFVTLNGTSAQGPVLVLEYPILPGYKEQEIRLELKTDYTTSDRCQTRTEPFSIFEIIDATSKGLVVVIITAGSRTYSHVIPVLLLQWFLVNNCKTSLPVEVDWHHWSQKTTLIKDLYSFYSNAPHVHGSRVMLSNGVGQFQVLDFTWRKSLHEKSQNSITKDDLMIDLSGNAVDLVMGILFTHAMSPQNTGPERLVDGVYFTKDTIIWQVSNNEYSLIL